MEVLNIQKENVIAAYQAASEEQKTLLRALFPDAHLEVVVEPEGYVRQQDKTIPVEERIYTFKDACLALGQEHKFVVDFNAVDTCIGMENVSPDIAAFFKLRIICAALNDGWEPEFTEDEIRWYPWHWLWTEQDLSEKSDEWKQRKALMSVEAYKQTGWAGFASANSDDTPSYTYASIGSRLCLKSESLADLAATRFIDLWADFKLIRRESAE